jgi:hypothetical protein
LALGDYAGKAINHGGTGSTGKNKTTTPQSMILHRNGLAFPRAPPLIAREAESQSCKAPPWLKDFKTLLVENRDLM